MPEYTFVVEAIISLNFTVEAEDRHEALAKAQSASVMGLCHQCAHGEEGEWCTSGEIDADPTVSRLVEALEDGNCILKTFVEDWEGPVGIEEFEEKEDK